MMEWFKDENRVVQTVMSLRVYKYTARLVVMFTYLRIKFIIILTEK